jgi:hypothetical protein
VNYQTEGSSGSPGPTTGMLLCLLLLKSLRLILATATTFQVRNVEVVSLN